MIKYYVSFIPNRLPSENNYCHYSLFNQMKSLDFGRQQFHSSYQFLYYHIIFLVNSAILIIKIKIPTNQRFSNTKLLIHKKMLLRVCVASFVSVTFNVKFKVLLLPRKPCYPYPLSVWAIFLNPTTYFSKPICIYLPRFSKHFPPRCNTCTVRPWPMGPSHSFMVQKPSSFVGKVKTKLMARKTR